MPNSLDEIEEKRKSLSQYALTGLYVFLGVSFLYDFFTTDFPMFDLGMGILLIGYSVVVWKS